MNSGDHKKAGVSSKPELDVKQALIMRREGLNKELQELDSVISRLQEEYGYKLETLQSRRKPLEEALRHVEALLQFEGFYLEGNLASATTDNALSLNARSSPTDAAFHLLTEIHQPLHYRDIALKLQERNIYIPGRDPAATLLSRINRDNRFKRGKGRGKYALSSWRMRSTKKKHGKMQEAKKH